MTNKTPPSVERYPLLREIFNGRDRAYSLIEASDVYGIERQRAERLLASAQNLPINGIDKLAVNVSDDYGKFLNLLAEVRFAVILASKGAKVEILRDQEFGAVAGRSTPDLRATFPGDVHALVEVTTCSGWWPKLSEKLDTAISEAGISFRVEHVVGAELGGSSPSYDSRERNDALCEAVAREVVKELVVAARRGLQNGTVHVFRSAGGLRSDMEVGQRNTLPFPDEVTTADGDSWLGSFVFRPANLGRGRTGGGVVAAHRVDVSSHEKRFLYRLEDKARKRRKLPPEYGSTLYFVAVQNDEIELPPEAILSILTGSRTYTSMPERERPQWVLDNPATHPRAVTDAMEAGWRLLFEEWDYGEESKYRLTDYGAYLKSAPWARNLSGVWVVHQTRSIVQWLPNPFAAPEINDSRLLEIGFAVEKGGVLVDVY